MTLQITHAQRLVFENTLMSAKTKYQQTRADIFYELTIIPFMP